jgi:hypothetical protein
VRVGSTPLRALLLIVLALCGALSGAAVAQQVDPTATVNSVISTITSETTVVSGTSGGSVGSGGSGASSSLPVGAGALSGAAGTQKTRFDRLPRRFETMLERIELGRNVSANIAGLRDLLPSAPALRARVLRLIRLEIRRLRRNGLTQRERAAIRRLRRLYDELGGWGVQTTTPMFSLFRPLAEAGIALPRAGGVLGTRSRSPSRAADRPGRRTRQETGRASPTGPLPWPVSPPSPPYWLLLLLTAIACLLMLAALAPRTSLPSPLRHVVTARRVEIRVLAVAVAFIVAFLIVFLLA